MLEVGLQLSLVAAVESRVTVVENHVTVADCHGTMGEVGYPEILQLGLVSIFFREHSIHAIL